eukprot:TRINITY_DN7500_c0_g1_i2.p1 TRINITY_DN7500_c0_g1~~TRINITY_DN7500_c0_g1_i2.p1  ORF type:complete len:126 (-),score=13.83 TRINITY_DN7500_c0_g1_i2:4-381(-)
MKWEVGLAQADHITGPWVRLPTNPVGLTPEGTSENPIVYDLSTANNKTGLYIVIFDYILNEQKGFGFSYSADGIMWNLGQLISIPDGCRTPLALLEDSDGTYTFFYTRTDGEFEALHFANFKLIL